MPFGFEYNNARELAKFLDCVRAVVDETPMRITKDSIYFNVMDPAHISMITMNLPVKTHGIEEDQIVTINLEEIKSIFENLTQETVALNCEKEKATWTLKLRKGVMDVTRAITVPIPDPLDDEVPEPKMPVKNEVRVPSNALLRELSEFEPHQHITLFIMAGEALVLHSEFDATGGTGVKRNIIKSRSGESPAFKVNKNEDNSVATYTTEFLLDYVKPLCEIFGAITLGWSEDGVLHIKGLIGEPHLVRYIIAPNIGLTPKVEKDE